MDGSIDLAIDALREAYRSGQVTPAAVLASIRERASHYQMHNIWIHLLSEQELAPYLARLETLDPAHCPLWGVPFAIKDNIDLAGIPTTAGCEAFRHVPEASATVVERLLDAGALPVGKTNLDQFATGLNGTRSPWGPCHNAFDPDYISGGSSSGSAVAVALGLASFSLGTDTAGSGRVPACFNNLVGLKPSLGLLPATGMLPACRSLDCMTIFASTSVDAASVLAAAEGYDPADAYSRHNPHHNRASTFGEHQPPQSIGVLRDDQLCFFGDQAYADAYRETLAVLREQPVELVEIDFAPFDAAAKLLYEGPWVAERYLATRPLIDEQPDAIFPVVRQIVEQGSKPAATDLFRAQYQLRALKQQCDAQLQDLDCLLTPTAGRCFTIDEMLVEPVQYNSQLGYYTNFMNLLDYASVAVPTQMASNGLPFGITLVGQVFNDRRLLSLARYLETLFVLPQGATGLPKPAVALEPVTDNRDIEVFVCGAHLEGMGLNWQLTERGARPVASVETAPEYRLFALPGGAVERPGLSRDPAQGRAVPGEVWRVPAENFGSFVAGIPGPLGIGRVLLADGSEVSGFICEAYGLAGAHEIRRGGWREYCAGGA